MKTTLEGLLTRIKKESALKAVESEKKKQAAKLERRIRDEPNMYQREELWLPIKLHRHYQLQRCDSCKEELVAFDRDYVELRHKVNPTAKRFRYERGETMLKLPQETYVEHLLVPECFKCLARGQRQQHLFSKGTSSEEIKQ